MTPDDLLEAAHGRALAAALQLVAAYRRGRRAGGSVDWADVDAAYEFAREAAMLAACHRRLGRRRQGARPAAGRGTP